MRDMDKIFEFLRISADFETDRDSYQKHVMDHFETILETINDPQKMDQIEYLRAYHSGVS